MLRRRRAPVKLSSAAPGLRERSGSRNARKISPLGRQGA
jgi:hypothetical protein